MKSSNSMFNLINVTVQALMIFAAPLLYGQNRTNFGLTRPQPEASLPVGIAKTDSAILRTKLPAISILNKNRNGDYPLNSGWELADSYVVSANEQSLFTSNYNSDNWYNAVVPGTVLTTLVQQGVYPDPYMGLNNMSIPEDLCRKDWWYRISFTAPAEEADKLVWLRLNGINYKADVWLNGKLVGKMNGAFVRGNFNVTGIIHQDKKNILAVHIYPPPNPGIPHEQSKLAGMGPNGGQLALDGPTFISSEGWDWVPGIRDRNIGIWQDVLLHYTDAVTLFDPQVITDLPLPDTSNADVTIKVGVKNNSDQRQSVWIKGTIDAIKVEKLVDLEAGEAKQVILSPDTHPQLKFKQPKLWWPNGYGSPYMYQLTLKAADNNDRISDIREVRFGIREFSYEMMIDAAQKKGWRISYSPTDLKVKKPIFNNVKRREFENKIFIPSLREDVDTSIFQTIPKSDNPFLVIKINGQAIFCRGGNWGMDDAMKKVSREELEPSFRLHKEANYNMIRNWTGECTEEVFYELADEYGMLVWNDFWISTEGYNLNPLDEPLFLKNSLETIRRFRNHPSIAIWCPRNEGYAPPGIEDVLYQQLMEEDGTRHYIGNSREVNLRQSGDWHYIQDPSQYFTKYADGFSTEIGTFSVPVATTLKKFIKTPDQWPINDVWHYHDLHSNNQNLEGYLTAVDSLFGKPEGIDAFSRKVQMVNYESHRAIFEAWNSKMWDRTSGVLLWMTHPAWPSMIWQTYSWDFETHGSYFGARKACEPVHVQMNLHDNNVIAVNSTLKNYKSVTLQFSVFDIHGKIIFAATRKTALPMNSKTEVFTPDFSAINLPEVYLVRLILTTEGGTTLSSNEYWKSNSATGNFLAFNQLPNAPLHITKIKSADGKHLLQLENKSASPVVGIKLNLADADNNILLPAYFSDGYFTMMPKEKREIETNYSGNAKGVKIRTEGYNSKPEFHVMPSIMNFSLK
jgi:hypothetical protein